MVKKHISTSITSAYEERYRYAFVVSILCNVRKNNTRSVVMAERPIHDLLREHCSSGDWTPIRFKPMPDLCFLYGSPHECDTAHFNDLPDDVEITHCYSTT